MTRSVPDLSIIIVTWNVREHVLQCLASIHADRARPVTEIILVDNASSDGTTAAVAAQFPDVQVIASVQNLGFPRANNDALRRARGRHVLFLNPDTQVREGTLAACVRELDTDGRLGAVGCRIEHADGSIQYEGARSAYHFRHLVFELLYLHMFFPRNRIFNQHLLGDWDHRGTRDVEVLSGAYIMVPRALALELGGLPDEMFMYHEDVSFCLRIHQAGRQLRYLGDVAIVHHGGRSASRSRARLRLLEVEAKYRFIRETDGRVWAALARPVLGLRALSRLAVCAVGVAVPRRWKQRYPRVFDWRSWALQLVWCVAPAATRHVMPRAPSRTAASAAGAAT